MDEKDQNAHNAESTVRLLYGEAHRIRSCERPTCVEMVSSGEWSFVDEPKSLNINYLPCFRGRFLPRKNPHYELRPHLASCQLYTGSLVPQLTSLFLKPKLSCGIRVLLPPSLVLVSGVLLSRSRCC